MGGASPYRARFIGLPPCGTNGGGTEGVPCENGEKYFGLVNVANTCYVNSVLQALYFCAPFRKSAIKYLTEDKEDDGGSNDSMLTSLGELFAQIENQKRTIGCLTPKRFLAKLRKANELFCTLEHQDAHEFMQFLLNDIVENVKNRVLRQREREKEKEKHLQQHGPGQNGLRPATFGNGAILSGDDDQPEEEPRTWVHDIFQGYLVNQMKCLCCENVTVRRETFLDLSVDIEQHTSIAACLRAFESTELLRAGNKFFCDQCGCLQEAEKRLRIYQLPSVLTLHLKRFKYVERLGRCCRLPYRVVFPLQLRVVEHRPPRRHSPTGANGGVPSPGRGNGVGIGAAVDSSTPMDGDESSTSAQPPSRLFELRSVVVHIGRDSNRGHYVTVVRQGERCVLLDDEVVRVVEPEVLRSFYGTAGSSSSHYHHGDSHGSNGHDRHGHHGGGGGWSTMDDNNDAPSGGGHGNSGDRYPSHSSHSVPLYERSSEGTCCGYLLLYEAVDGTPENDLAGQVIDVGAAADWISEDRNLTDSDSGESAEENRAGSTQDRPHPNACDDSEQTQAFEQRCIPRSPAMRQQQTSGPAAAAPAAAASAPGSAAGDVRGRERVVTPGLDRPAPGSGGHGAFAWTAADGEGGRAPPTNNNHSSHG